MWSDTENKISSHGKRNYLVDARIREINEQHSCNIHGSVFEKRLYYTAQKHKGGWLVAQWVKQAPHIQRL